MPKQRFNFAFNLESPEHLRAYAEFVSWPPRKRGEYIIQAILRRIDSAHWNKIVYEAVIKALDERGGMAIAMQGRRPYAPPVTAQELSDEAESAVPANQMGFLMEVASGAMNM